MVTAGGARTATLLANEAITLLRSLLEFLGFMPSTINSVEPGRGRPPDADSAENFFIFSFTLETLALLAVPACYITQASPLPASYQKDRGA